jgi:hypothetical protein
VYLVFSFTIQGIPDLGLIRRRKLFSSFLRLLKKEGDRMGRLPTLF